MHEFSFYYCIKNLERKRKWLLKTKSSENKKSWRMRRMRLFGFNNSILSNTTVYLNSSSEGSSHLSAEEIALFDEVTRNFKESNS